MTRNNKKKEIKAAKAVVSGRVQGVFYRTWTRNNAKSLNLKGWVRNTDDGKVEAFFEGKKEDILEMLERCEEGSKFSDVKDVEMEWVDPEKFTSFVIKF